MGFGKNFTMLSCVDTSFGLVAGLKIYEEHVNGRNGIAWAKGHNQQQSSTIKDSKFQSLQILQASTSARGQQIFETLFPEIQCIRIQMRRIFGYVDFSAFHLASRP